jgi:hypothetical protein
VLQGPKWYNDVLPRRANLHIDRHLLCVEEVIWEVFENHVARVNEVIRLLFRTNKNLPRERM